MDDKVSSSHLQDHRKLEEPSRYAAVVVANILDRWIETSTVLDLGCGVGAWLRGFANSGQREVVGVEGERLDPADLVVDPDLVLHADLSQHLDLKRQFDLVLCLEVAEHIPAAAAATVVGNCVRHAKVVLFSAALPGQQGRHHVNEQEPEYWVSLFASLGYEAFDVIRPLIWNDQNIPVWYRQNILLFVRNDCPVVARLQLEAEQLAITAPLNRAHPDLLQWFSHELSVQQEAAAEATRTSQALQHTLTENLSQLAEARATLNRTMYAVTLLTQERDTIVNSTVWRVMAPIRRAGRIIPAPARHALRRLLQILFRMTRTLRYKSYVRASSPAKPGTRQPNRKNWRIVVVSGEPDIAAHTYRASRFAEAASAIGANVLTIGVEQLAAHKRELTQADFVLIWRAANSRAVTAAVALVREGGGKLLVDVDDLMFVPELAREDVIDGIRSQKLNATEVSRHFTRVREVMAQADACICTTNELATHARSLGKVTFILPNGFDHIIHAASRLAVRRRRLKPLHDGLIRIGYAAGTRTHQRDFKPAAEALARVLQQYPTCRLVLFRKAEDGVPTLDPGEFPALQALQQQIEWRSIVPLPELPEELARFDINLAPLETGNPFCEAKSELKYFEAALAGVCTIASPTDPMRIAIRHRETGMLADSPDEWFNSLVALIESPELRQRLAHAAYLDVLWRYGPHRRADLVLDLLTQIAGGPDAARAFELEFRRRHSASRIEPLELVRSDVVFYDDKLGDADVTVVLPLYNYSQYVVEALESVKAQTVSTLDLVIVDDCSTDTSLAVARSWAEEHAKHGRFNRIVVMHNAVNSGLARTRNVGIDAAETDFVLPLDADNKLKPEFCAKTLAALRGTRAAFAYTKIQCFGDHSHVIGDDPFSQMAFAQANYIDAMALVAKWAWAAVGGYTHIQHGWEDYDFWCCCVEQGLWGIHVPEILAEYRFHKSSMLRTTTDIQHNKREVVRQLEQRHDWLSIVDRG